MANNKTPWTWAENDDRQIMIYDDDGDPVAAVISTYYEDCANMICNAVDEFVARHCMVDIASYGRICADNKRLRDLVRRLVDDWGHYAYDGMLATDSEKRRAATIREAREILGDKP